MWKSVNLTTGIVSVTTEPVNDTTDHNVNLTTDVSVVDSAGRMRSGGGATLERQRASTIRRSGFVAKPAGSELFEGGVNDTTEKSSTIRRMLALSRVLRQLGGVVNLTTGVPSTLRWLLPRGELERGTAVNVATDARRHERTPRFS